jgi:hypothetical protein
MTSIVNRMISLLSSAAEAIFDVSAHLESASAGLRLAGYAYLYANPDRSHSEEIIDSLLKEEKPFSQYWALRALRRQVEAALPAALDLGTRSRLEELMPSFPPGTDRARELRAILGDRLG